MNSQARKHSAPRKQRTKAVHNDFRYNDRNQVTDIVNYIWDITEFVKGHRQGSNA
jgi:hypothetical protein